MNIISFSDWLENRDKDLSNNIQNEVHPALMRAAMALPLLGAGIEAKHGMSPPHRDDEKIHQEEGDTEVETLAHYVAEHRMRKLMKLSRKLGMDFQDPNFKKWLMDMWGEYIGEPATTFRQLLSGVKSVTDDVRQHWMDWMLSTIHGWKDPVDELPPAEMAPFYTKDVGGFMGNKQNRLHTPVHYRKPIYEPTKGQSGYLKGRGHRGI